MTKLDLPAKELRQKRYGYNAEYTLKFINREHTPYNKRSGDVDSILNVDFEAPPHGNWITIRATETTTTRNFGDKPDRTQGRTISFTLDEAMADRIAEFIAKRRQSPIAP